MSQNWNNGMMTSLRGDWRTPRQLFDWLDREFGFTSDVAATPENALAPLFDGEAAAPWTGVAWCNPPYGREIGAWVEKAFRSSRFGATVVCLLPARTDTSWWHDYVMKAAEIRFIRGRIEFEHPEHHGKSRAPFPSAIVVFQSPEPRASASGSQEDPAA